MTKFRNGSDLFKTFHRKISNFLQNLFFASISNENNKLFFFFSTRLQRLNSLFWLLTQFLRLMFHLAAVSLISTCRPSIFGNIFHFTEERHHVLACESLSSSMFSASSLRSMIASICIRSVRKLIALGEKRAWCFRACTKHLSRELASHTRTQKHIKIDVIRYCNDKLNQEQLFSSDWGAQMSLKWILYYSM